MDKKTAQKVEELIDNQDLKGLVAQIDELSAQIDEIQWQIVLTQWLLVRMESTLFSEGWHRYYDVDRKFLSTIRRANKVTMKVLEKAMDKETAHKFTFSVVSHQPCTFFEVALGESEPEIKEIIEKVDKEYSK